MGTNITPEQLEALVQYAAKRLHISPQQLSQTIQTQGVDALSPHLSPQDTAKIQGFDRAEAEKLLQSAQVQELLKKLSGGGTI